MDKIFKLKENKTDVKTEILAGITTFATMAYILAINSAILKTAGLDEGAVFVATALAAIVGTVAMAFLANLPLAIAPGMGLNAFFAYTVVGAMGYTPQFALAAVFTEGLIFIVISVTGIRKKLFDALPLTLKYAVAAGIGMFIIFIGLQNAGVVVMDGATMVTMGDLKDAVPGLAVIGIAITIILMVRKVKAALLIGIFATWALGIMAQFAGWYAVEPAADAVSLIPAGIASLPPGLAPTFGLFIQGFHEIFVDMSSFMSFLAVMLAFLFVDLFDAIGTLAGVASKAKLLDKHGELKNINQALLADAISTSVGAALGTSTTTTYIESASGIQAGGKTGLTALTTAVFFGLSLLFAPLFLAIPAFATTGALVVVGILMLEPLGNMKLSDLEVSIPAGITIIAMPLFYSISHGLAFGFIAYVIVKAAAGKGKEVPALAWVLAAVFAAQMVLAG